MIKNIVKDYVEPIIKSEDLGDIYFVDKMTNVSSSYPYCFLGYAINNNCLKEEDIVKDFYLICVTDSFYAETTTDCIEYFVIKLTLDDIEDIENGEYTLRDLMIYKSDDFYLLLMLQLLGECTEGLEKIDKFGLQVLLDDEDEVNDLSIELSFQQENILEYIKTIIEVGD